MITDILIEEGQSVTKDQVLFIIDQTSYKAAYEIEKQIKLLTMEVNT